MSSLSGWGNGRDALTLWHKIMEERAQRVIQIPETSRIVTEADAQSAVDLMMTNRKRKISKDFGDEPTTTTTADSVHSKSIVPKQRKCTQPNVREYPTKFKLEVIAFFKTHSLNKTAEHFGINKNTVKKWIKRA